MKKVIVITGATNGIGASTAHALAKMGHRLILTGRNEAKLSAIKNEILDESDNEDIDTVWMPQDELSKVRSGAGEILSKTEHIDVLINNAGAIYMEYVETKDGFESSFGVNHLSHFLLTDLLMPALKAAPSARIINVASEAHRGAQFKGTWIPQQAGFVGFSAYALSKLANIVYSNELARRLEGTAITVNSLHPGVVKTGFASDATGWFSWMFALARPFMISADKGAETSVFLASDKQVQGKSGGYYVRKKLSKPMGIARKTSVAEVLWRESEDAMASVL